ncbi:phosphoinositide 3-kinase adapter protein 1 isoform X2 [Cimex lectularius]|nr:phosphoinositide 3-kinase adapter protein 1 isoform X2 [Cimex lectularius]XP_014253062.1 phosphoinositide 3-kinase adapter protein 1 isoform X2 [Cimex lectularius]
MMDITILSSRESNGATLWVNYLTTCFQQISREQQKPPFKLAKVCVEDVLGGLPVEGSSGSRLQIVIVCPTFLDALTSSTGVPILASLLQPASVLAMLLGVTSKNLDCHPLTSLFRFEQWRKQEVKDQNPTFVGDFLGIAMDILSRSWQLQQAIAQMKVDNNRAHFSIIPKKIKVGQNKLLILLNDPISSNDKITISIEKSGTKIDVPSVKRRNPYTLQFAMPSSCLQTSMLVAVNVERNGRSLGHKLVKCESRLRELDQLLKSADNPLVFMCQALGLTSGDKDHLDAFLVATFQKNMPPNFNLLNATTGRDLTSNEEYPTLLHFAARYGLEKLCWQLLECPGGELACQLKNAGQQTPAELADKSGHQKLAHALQGYLQMTELSSMYSYLKGVSEKQDEQKFEDGNYLMPRPLSDTYLIPPKARPVLPNLPIQENYSLSSSPKDVFLSSPKELFAPKEAYQVPPSPSEVFQIPKSPKEYYQMPPSPKEFFPVPESPLENYQSPPMARPFTPITPSTPSSPLDGPKFSAYLQMHSPVSQNFDQILGPEKKYASVNTGTDNLSIASSGHNYVNTSSSTSICSKTPEDELVEIINDFKNNVFTIGEVEKLVEAWRNRNDVQQSFREKQEQLAQMRQEYERIQQQMKDQMKRATPFERIKKFFSRKSKHDVSCKGRNPADPNSPHRPVSSLSLHSSCSSSSCGRMSTSSGTSLGDSGTHSDPDEKKAEIMAADKIFSCPDTVFHERLASVKENEASNYCHDEYVCASPAVFPLKAALPKPPITGRTIVEVHRSDESIQEEEKENDKKEINYINTNGEKTAQTEETSSEEMKYLEQSEKLLKDMANGLTHYEEDDVLSPPESAFLQDGETQAEAQESDISDVQVDEDASGQVQEPEGKHPAQEDNRENIEDVKVEERLEEESKEGKNIEVKEENETKDDKKTENDECSLPTQNGEQNFSENVTEEIKSIEAVTKEIDDDTFSREYINVSHTAVTKEIFSIESDHLQSYVNVSFPSPPIPPRIKYKNILL